MPRVRSFSRRRGEAPHRVSVTDQPRRGTLHHGTRARPRRCPSRPRGSRAAPSGNRGSLTGDGIGGGSHQGPLPISYADAFAVVTARDRAALVVTGDREFRPLATPVSSPSHGCLDGVPDGLSVVCRGRDAGSVWPSLHRARCSSTPEGRPRRDQRRPAPPAKTFSEAASLVRALSQTEPERPDEAGVPVHRRFL